MIAFALYTSEIKGDIELHQYIPGVFPRLSIEGLELYQHSTHHYGPLEPYGFAFNLGDKGGYKLMPDEMRNAIELDERMGFKWDNPTFRRTKALYQKYHNVNSKQNNATNDNANSKEQEPIS